MNATVYNFVEQRIESAQMHLLRAAVAAARMSPQWTDEALGQAQADIEAARAKLAGREVVWPQQRRA